MSLEQDPLYLEFMNRNLKPSTQVRYRIILSKYVESTGLSLSDLVNEAESDEDNNIRLRKRRIKKHLDNHIQTLQELDYSPKNIRLNISTIRVFYNHFEIQLPKVYLPPVEDNKTTDDIPGHYEIWEAISHANAKYTAMILLMSSSGMGMAEVLSLLIKDLLISAKLDPTNIDQLSEIQPKTILWWSVTRIKTNHNYYTFSSPETTTYILEYLKQQPPQTIDDHLFRSGKGTSKGNPLQSETVRLYFKRVNDKCDFGLRGRQRYFKTHNLRKFFATTCESHIPHMATRHMMGHKFGGVEGAYFLRNQKALYNEYRKVVEYLTILEPVTVIDTEEEMQNLNDRVAELERALLEKQKKENQNQD